MELLGKELLWGELSSRLDRSGGSRGIGRHGEVSSRLLDRRLTGEESKMMCLLIRLQDLFSGSGKIVLWLQHVVRGRISLPSNLIQYLPIALLPVSNNGFDFI